jgi:hypothetical protein
VGLRGDLLASFREDSPRTTSALRDFVHSVRKRATVPVLGIGIGCKGVIDAATTRVNRLPGDLNFLEGCVLRELAGVDGLPLCADNDARTALVGEVLWGAARGRRNVVLLTLGYRSGRRSAGRWRDRARRLGSGVPPGTRHPRHSRRTLHLRQLRMSGNLLLFARHRVRLLCPHPSGVPNPFITRRCRPDSQYRGYLSGSNGGRPQCASRVGLWLSSLSPPRW